MPHLRLAVLLAATVVDAQSPAPGFHFVSQIGSNAVPMYDSLGNLVHTWNTSFAPGLGCYLLPDGTLLRAIAAVNNGVPGGFGGGVQRLLFDGTVLWDYRHFGTGYQSHHDIAPLPNGNVLLTVWEDKTALQAIAAGRDPQLLTGNVFRLDSIVEVQPTGPTTGTVVWSWHVFDHLVQDYDATQANYGVVGNAPGRIDVNYPANAAQATDWTHVNGIDYDAEHDWIAISAYFQGEIWVIDHGTTTAEAAGSIGGARGHGGDLLYRWGNPECYRAGTPLDRQLDGQHDPRFIRPGAPGAGNLTVFDNHYTANTSAVHELVLPLDAAGNFVMNPNRRFGPTAPVWTYTSPTLYSPIISSAERLPNGNTMICSGLQAQVFEVDASGAVLWRQVFPIGSQLFQAQYTEQTLWIDRASVSTASGGQVHFDLLGGTQHSGDLYLLLGSAAGTSPGLTLPQFLLPLNPDFLFAAMLANPNQAPALNQTFGTLDAAGGAAAWLDLAPGLVPSALVGVHCDFAFVTADPSAALLRASNAVGFTFLP